MQPRCLRIVLSKIAPSSNSINCAMRDTHFLQNICWQREINSHHFLPNKEQFPPRAWRIESAPSKLRNTAQLVHAEKATMNHRLPGIDMRRSRKCVSCMEQQHGESKVSPRTFINVSKASKQPDTHIHTHLPEIGPFAQQYPVHGVMVSEKYCTSKLNPIYNDSPEPH